MLQRILKSQVGRNALLLYGVQISGYLLPLVTLPYLARVLAPEKFGLIALAQNFLWYFVTLTDYSFNLTATRQIAVERDDLAAVSKTFSIVMIAKLLLMLAGFGLMAAVVFAVPSFRREWPLFFVCYLTVAASVVFPVWLFQGLQKMQYIGLRDIGAKVLVLIAVFAFVREQSDYLVAAAIQSGGLFLSGLIGLAAAPAAVSVRFSRPSCAEVRAVFADGWRVFVSVALANVYLATNVVVLGLVASPLAVGFFNAAWRVMAPLRSLVAPLSTVLYPHVSRIAATDPAQAVRFLQRYALRMSAPFFLLGLGLAISAPFLVPLAFGPNYERTILPLQIMSFAPFLLSLSHCFATYYMLGFGFTKEWSRLSLFSGLANFTALALLLPVVAPEIAGSLAMVTQELAILIPSYLFYRRNRHASARLEPEAAVVPSAT